MDEQGAALAQSSFNSAMLNAGFVLYVCGTKSSRVKCGMTVKAEVCRAVDGLEI